MYRLYHHVLCPFSRKVRAHLLSKNVDFELVSENYWQRRKEFIALNPAGQIPVLFDNSKGLAVCGSDAIVEYIEEKHVESRNFLGDSIEKRAETRRLQNWFDHKFYFEVSKHVLNERYFNRYLPGAKAPNSEILRVARSNLNVHLSYIEYLLETRKYLSGDLISIADFAAASQISVLDYFGDVNWQYNIVVKEWYSLIKSHRAFSEILRDQVASVKPPQWYEKLDF